MHIYMLSVTAARLLFIVPPCSLPLHTNSLSFSFANRPLSTATACRVNSNRNSSAGVNSTERGVGLYKICVHSNAFLH